MNGYPVLSFLSCCHCHSIFVHFFFVSFLFFFRSVSLHRSTRMVKFVSQFSTKQSQMNSTRKKRWARNVSPDNETDSFNDNLWTILLPQLLILLLLFNIFPFSFLFGLTFLGRPILGVEAVLVSVLSMLSDANFESPANIDASVELKNDPKAYKARVRKLVRDSMDAL